jgi:hypothetical protein
MVAEAEVMHQAAVPVLEVQYHRCVAEEVAAPAEVGVEVDFAVDAPQMVSVRCSCFSVPLLCKKKFIFWSVDRWSLHAFTTLL